MIGDVAIQDCGDVIRERLPATMGLDQDPLK
jgi:hypothetical protein